MASEVSKLLDALHAGSVSIDEVADRFRRRRWPARPSGPPVDHMEMAAASLEDPEPSVPGSFDDVVAAYDAKKITREQFQVLSKAAAEAQQAQD